MAFRIPGDTVDSRFRKRMERAQQVREEQERLQHDIVSRRIAHMEFEEEMRRWQERMAYGMYLLAGTILDRLVQIRDENRPACPDDPWNEAFCRAVELIPEARRFEEDCMMDCMKEKEDGH